MASSGTRVKSLLSLLLALALTLGLLAVPAGAQPRPTTDLAVTKTDSPDPAVVGQNVTFTVTVGNLGPDPAGLVVLSESFSGAGVQFVSATPSQGSCDFFPPGLVLCVLGAIPARGEATVTIVVRPTQPGTIVNTAFANNLASSLDPNPGNNIATTTTTVVAAPPPPPPPPQGGPVELETENEAESGGVELGFEVSNTGNFADQCAPADQFGLSGNSNNTPAALQDTGGIDDIEPGGIEGSVSPELAAECERAVQQSAAAGG